MSGSRENSRQAGPISSNRVITERDDYKKTGINRFPVSNPCEQPVPAGPFQQDDRQLARTDDVRPNRFQELRHTS